MMVTEGLTTKARVAFTVSNYNSKGRIVGELTAHIVFCYRCFLPDLTGFTKLRCVRPNKTAKILKFKLRHKEFLLSNLNSP